MKKNKIIIPAMAMILFSTAASISGTVAWFTASRAFETTVGNFNVVEIDGHLDVTMAASQGTVLDTKNNSVSVIDYATKGTAVAATTEPGGVPADGDLWIDTSGADPVLKVYATASSAYIAKDGMAAGDTYLDSTGKVYRATGESNKLAATDKKANHGGNPVVLTHGSFNPNDSVEKAFVIDNDSDPNNPSYLDKKVDAERNWLQKADATIADSTPADAVVDVYNAVSWTMTFSYTFASDNSSIAVYLDLAKSKFYEPSPLPNPKFTKDGDSKHFTSRGFRIGFYGTGHDVVWGNNQPLMSAPEAWTSGPVAKGQIRRYTDGGVYKANKATSTTWVESEWDKIYDLPDYAPNTDYKKGDKVVSETKVYQRKTAGKSPAAPSTFTDDKANWDLLTVAEHSTTTTYAVGDKVTHEGRVYKCLNPITYTDTPIPWNDANWERNGDVRFAPDYPEHSSIAYSKGAIVKKDGMLYQCKADIAAHGWERKEWNAYDSSDLRYVSSEDGTTFYDKTNYIVSDNGYQKLDNLNANEYDNAVSAPERICVLTTEHPTVTVKCAAWFEGCDPNVISGAVMECLTADMAFYSRTVNPHA